MLNLFDYSANLVFDTLGVLSLVCPELGPGPFAFVLSEKLRLNDELTISSRVEFRPGQIHVGDIRFDFSRAGCWDPDPGWQELKQANLSWALKRIESVAKAAAIQPALSGITPPRQWGRQAAADFAAGVAGLGPGLTPSGDDVLVGVMHALWASRPAGEAEQICGWLADAAIPKTTTLSAAWLNAAKSGQASFPWHRLVHAMTVKNEARLERASQEILSAGHTSGADSLSGFLGVFGLET